MPPYNTETMGADNQESFNFVASALSTIDSGHKRQPIFPERMRSHQREVTDATKDSCIKEFTLDLQYLKEHVQHLLESQNGGSHTLSPVDEACLYSLRHMMPRLLEEASMLIERMKKQDVGELMVMKLRCSFSMAAAGQFLDTIEYNLTCPVRDIIDERLSLLLEDMAELTDHDDYFTFRVSQWTAPSLRLAFDLPASKPTTVVLRDSFPISITVEPLITYPMEDLLSIYKELSKPRICTVEVEECKHSPFEFAEGADIIGTAFVKIRLTPVYDHDADVEEDEDNAWGLQKNKGKIVIREARVIQQNSYPPKPHTAVDLYTSEGSDDPGVTITLVIKTCNTEHGEPPKLHICLALATSSPAH